MKYIKLAKLKLGPIVLTLAASAAGAVGVFFSFLGE